MGAANTGVRCIVERRIRHPASVQLGNALASFIPQAFDFTELYRLGRTRFRASRSKPHLLAVTAECALEGAPVIAILINYSKRTRHHAIPAAVADIRLNVNSTEFGAHNRAGRASL